MPIIIDDAHLHVLRVFASVQAVCSDVYIFSSIIVCSISDNCKYSSILSSQLLKVSDSYLMNIICIFFMSFKILDF